MIEIGADKLIVWDGLIDNFSGSYVNDATVTGSLQELDGTVVGTFSLTYETSSNGKYEGIITAAVTATLTSCEEYVIVLTATKSTAVGKKIVREVAIDATTCWFRFNHPYLSSLSLSTSDDEAAVSLMIHAAQEAIEKEIGRTVKEAEHDEIVYISCNGSALLRQFPVTYVSRVMANRIDCISLQNTSAQVASFTVDALGLKLVRYVAGTKTTNSLAFSTYTTLSSLVTAVDNIGSGWNATLLDANYANYPTVDLVKQQYGECKTTANSLVMWESDSRVFDVNPLTGSVESEFGRGSKVRFIYGAGYSDVPEPLKKIAAELVKNHFDSKEGALASESLGDYSYNLAAMSEQLGRLPINNLKILNGYKSNQVR